MTDAVSSLLHCEVAYAKINLALHVRRRRDDGYHDIESLFAFAQDGDVIEAQARADCTINLTIDGPFGDGLDNGPDNLVMRAARALQAISSQVEGADIHLIKKLPVASGIGGGSADAAATLRLLARLWRVADDGLMAIAATLGSDVPACLISHTLVGSGRGEALEVRDLPGLSGAPMLLVNPGVGLSTAPVFAGWDRIDRGPLRADTLDQVIGEGRNDLAPSATALVPAIGDVLALLGAQAGVRLARMSGSGATCFALFDTGPERDQAQAAIMAEQPHWWTTATKVRQG